MLPAHPLQLGPDTAQPVHRQPRHRRPRALRAGHALHPRLFAAHSLDPRRPAVQASARRTGHQHHRQRRHHHSHRTRQVSGINPLDISK